VNSAQHLNPPAGPRAAGPRDPRGTGPDAGVMRHEEHPVKLPLPVTVREAPVDRNKPLNKSSSSSSLAASAAQAKPRGASQSPHS